MLELLLWFTLFSSTLAVSFVSTGSTVVLNGIPYYVPAKPVTTFSLRPEQLKSAAAVADLMPLTAIETSRLTFTQKDLDETVANFTAKDDVFQPGFLQGTEMPHCAI